MLIDKKPSCNYDIAVETSLSLDQSWTWSDHPLSINWLEHFLGYKKFETVLHPTQDSRIWQGSTISVEYMKGL